MITFNKQKKLIKAAKLLKDNCTGRFCLTCIFSVGPGMGCGLGGVLPFYWKLSKFRRVTDKDITLTKSIKAIGFKYFFKKPDGSVILAKEYGDVYVIDREGRNSYE